MYVVNDLFYGLDQVMIVLNVLVYCCLVGQEVGWYVIEISCFVMQVEYDVMIFMQCNDLVWMWFIVVV